MSYRRFMMNQQSGQNRGRRARGPQYDPDAVIFFGNLDFATPEYTDAEVKKQVNDLAVRYKDMGTWDDKLWIFPNVGGTMETIQRSLKNFDLFSKFYPNSATFNWEGDSYDGINQYSTCGCYPGLQMSSYSLCTRYFVKQATFGADDYSPLGQEVGLIIDHFFNNRLFVVLGRGNAPAHVWVLNPAPFGKLMAINYYDFDTVDYWQDGVKAGTQIDDVRGYLPPLDPSDPAAQLYLSATNHTNTPITLAPFTYFYQDFGMAMQDADLASDDDYLKNVFCPALSKIPD